MKKLKKKFKFSSQKWLDRNNKDKYIKLSKESGFRSRAYFKLQEVNQKFHILKNNIKILDLGSAPGAWSQLIGKINKDGLNFAIDILDMKNTYNVKFVKGDFTSDESKLKINTFFENQKIDLILSDIAVNTTGNKNLDSIKTNSIVIDVLKFSSLNLADNGKIFFKFFNGLESETIIKYVKKNFSTHKILKPDSSRKASKEVYMLCSS